MISRGAEHPPRLRRLIGSLPIAAIVLTPLVFYFGMIVGGREPAAPDTIAVRPLGEWARETTRTLGTTPLWNPYLFSGMPSYGSYVYTPASPLSPLDHLLQLFRGQRGIRYYILMVLGGLVGYAFFRRQKISAPAAAIASLAFVLTPYVPGLIEAGHSTKLRALMHVPLLLLAIDLFLERPGPLAAAFLALAAAMLGWANHPQILYYGVMVGFLYALGRIATDRSIRETGRLVRGAIWLAVSGAVALCLIAEPTLAVREYAPYSIRGTGESGGASWGYATAWSFPPGELVSFLFPEFYGLKGATYFGTLPFTQSTHYVGIVLLMVVLVGFLRRRDARSWIWLAISLVLLMIGFGQHFPLLYRPLFDLLPYFSKFRVPSMIYSLLPLTLAYLVAAGLDSLATSERREKRSAGGGTGKGWLLAAGFAAAIAVVAFVIGVTMKEGGTAGSGWFRPDEARGLSQKDLGHLIDLRWQMRITSIVRGMLLLGITLAAVPVARRLRAPGGSALLGAILLIDVCIVGAKFVSLSDPAEIDEVLQPTPAIEYLARQEGPFRVFPIDHFGSNRYVAFGIGTVGGYQPAKLRLYQDLLVPRDGLGRAIERPGPNDRTLLDRLSILRMLNVRYLVSPADPGHPSFRRVSEDVYEYADALPRGWFVPSWRSVPDEELVLRELARGDFDPGSVAILLDSSAPALPREGLPIREVEVDSVGPHLVRMRVGGGEGPGLLVVSEIYYPAGWGGSIDGDPAPILRANHCLRALVVPPGEHRVEMRFVSKGYETGRILNRAGGVAVLLLALAGAWAAGLLRRRGT